MTETTATPPANVPAELPDFVPTETYDVQLRRAVEWPKDSGFWFRPIHHHLMSGATCKEIADGIASARQV